MSSFSELIASLIPQSRLHFPLIAYVPITNNADNITYACTELGVMSFDHNYQMNNVDPRLGKYLSICMMFRGELTPTNINTTIAFIQRGNTIPVTQNMNSPPFKVIIIHVRLNFNIIRFVLIFSSLDYAIGRQSLCHAVE